MTIHQYVSKAVQDDARLADERNRLVLEARRAPALSLLQPPQEVPVGDHGRDEMPAVQACPTPPPIPQKPSEWWKLLHVALAGTVAIIATILLGNLLAAWMTMQ
jgi:hypothetical protein